VKDTVAPVRPADRVDSIDVVRGLALFGVMAVNVLTEFHQSLFQQFLPPVAESNELDRLTDLFAQYGLNMKAFSLFSFLFGIGLAIQYERLSPHGSAMRWLVRRLAVLLAFGLIHFYLIWNGDILTEYAFAGFVVLPFLQAPRWLLGVSACAFLLFYVVMPFTPLDIPWPIQAWFRQHVAEANFAYGHASFLASHRFSFHEVADIIPLHLSLFARTVGLFLLGALTWRAGLLKDPRGHRRALIILALVFITAGALLTYADGTNLAMRAFSMRALGRIVERTAPATLALGYCAAIVCLVEFTPARAALRAFAPLGRMAFSNYIAQSLIFSVLFYGFGLGLYGRIGPAASLAVGTSVYVAQMLFSVWWLRRYRFGPLEWLWRTLMYGSRQPMRQIDMRV
jgi:uncharacterized protein